MFWMFLWLQRVQMYNIQEAAVIYYFATLIRVNNGKSVLKSKYSEKEFF